MVSQPCHPLMKLCQVTPILWELLSLTNCHAQQVLIVPMVLWPVPGLIAQPITHAHKVLTSARLLLTIVNVVTDAQQRLLMLASTHKLLATTPLPLVRQLFSAQQVSIAHWVQLDQDHALLDTIVRLVLRITETLHAPPVSTVRASSSPLLLNAQIARLVCSANQVWCNHNFAPPVLTALALQIRPSPLQVLASVLHALCAQVVTIAQLRV